jgi:thymidylate synthase
MMAQVSGLIAGELVHVIADAHIYDRHVPIIEELIEMEEHKSPALIIDKDIDDFYKFTVDSFKLLDYKFNPFKVKVPIAV